MKTARRPLTITLPLPPVALSPNGSHRHWAVKAKAARAYRNQAEMEARRIPARRREAWDRAEVRVTYYHQNRRRRDADNALASLKNAMDGLVRAGVLADDHGVTYPPVRFIVGRQHTPRVELVITPVDET